jgi:hypothetical protein
MHFSLSRTVWFTIEERKLLMNELFPLACGVFVGSFLGVLRPERRLRLAVLLSVVLGFTATVVSGEFRIGWEYVLVDIPLVAVSAAAAYLLVGAFARRSGRLSG